MHNSQRISCKQFISQTRPLSAAFPGFAMGLCFLLACGAAMAGDVYRWTDSDGTVHFGEHPPQGVSATRLSTSTGKRSTREPRAKTTSESGSTEEAVNTDGEDKKATASAKPPKPKKNKDICERARFNLKTLSERARIRQVDENGEESYLNEEQKDEQKKAAKEAIKTFC